MPIYEYECPHCGYCFEEITSLKEADRSIPCPQCGKDDAQRRISLIAGRGGSCGSSCASCSSSPVS